MTKNLKYYQVWCVSEEGMFELDQQSSHSWGMNPQYASDEENRQFGYGPFDPQSIQYSCSHFFHFFQETIDFTNTLSASWLQVKECANSYDDSMMELVPGFSYYSSENCKMAKVQRGANVHAGCNMVTLPINNARYTQCE